MYKTHDNSGTPLLRRAEVALLTGIKSLPHTQKELQALMNMLTTERPYIESITIGHGRDQASTIVARELASLWEATGGFVLKIIDWPEEAASWFKPAKRFTDETPDAWIVTGPILGWAQMSCRLKRSTDWDPSKTFGFSSVADSRFFNIVGLRTLEGMRGVLNDGTSWRLSDGQFITYPNESEYRSSLNNKSQ